MACDLRARADFGVTGYADLPAHHNEIADIGAACNAHLRRDQTMPTNRHIMRDLDEVLAGRKERAFAS